MQATVTRWELRKWKRRFPGLWALGMSFMSGENFAVRCIGADKLDCAPCEVEVARDGWGNFLVHR
jgi:hypothetical protein